MIKFLEMAVINVVEQNTFGDQRRFIGSVTGKVGYFKSAQRRFKIVTGRYKIWSV